MQAIHQLHAPPIHTHPHHQHPMYPRQSLNNSTVSTASTTSTTQIATKTTQRMPQNIHVPTPPLSRKRKRPLTQFSVSYSEVQELDPNSGRLREVIVIDDSPPPPSSGHPPSTISPALSLSTNHTQRTSLQRTSTQRTTTNNGYSASYQPPVYNAPIRTRARAAAEAQTIATASNTTASTSSGAGTVAAAPAQKKRKRDLEDSGTITATKRPITTTATGGKQSGALATTKSWHSGSGATTEDTSKGPPPCDDKEGHYIIVPDDIIFRRYRTIRLLGQGTFGKVVEAIDITNQTRVAIKIIRAIPKYRDASKIEVRVLQKLKERDPANRHKCIHLLNWFDHRNHICLVSELLGMCVYDFLKDNDFQPFPRRHIQDFARQLLGSVAFLHDLHLIHTDLKPENILLVHNGYRTINYVTPGKRHAPPRQKRVLGDTDIRLIDFGSATFEEEYHSTVVSTRHYRAPEIILGLGWSYPCDVFSLGCILVEFYTGVALFQTHDNLEHLAMMEMVMGLMPERIVRAGARSKPEFFKEGVEGRKLDWPKPKASRQSKKDVRGTRSLQELIPPKDTINQHFLDLVMSLLAFDPAQRLSVRDALNHPYFGLNVPMEDL